MKFHFSPFILSWMRRARKKCKTIMAWNLHSFTHDLTCLLLCFVVSSFSLFRWFIAKDNYKREWLWQRKRREKNWSAELCIRYFEFSLIVMLTTTSLLFFCWSFLPSCYTSNVVGDQFLDEKEKCAVFFLCLTNGVISPSWDTNWKFLFLVRISDTNWSKISGEFGESKTPAGKMRIEYTQ